MDGPGFLSFRFDNSYYTLFLPVRPWLAVELLRYLDDVLDSAEPTTEILKLLGYTIQIGKTPPPHRGPDWVIVHLSEKLIESNSQLLRDIVDQRVVLDCPLPPSSRDKIYSLLDQHDFTVKLYS